MQFVDKIEFGVKAKVHCEVLIVILLQRSYALA